MTPDEKSIAESNIIREASNINQLYQGCAERAVKSLLLMNGGGVVTVLAYIFHADKFLPNTLLRLSLISFLLGLILAVYVVAQDFQYARNKLLGYNSDVRKFLHDKNLTFTSIQWFNPEQPKDKSPEATVRIGELSVALFIIGILSGLFGYLFSLT